MLSNYKFSLLTIIALKEAAKQKAKSVGEINSSLSVFDYIVVCTRGD
jgi:hypothetical protein